MTTKHLPSGSLFPMDMPTDNEIKEMQARYLICQVEGDLVVVYDQPGPPTNLRTVVLKAPKHYTDLMRRMVWRRALLLGLLDPAEGVMLDMPTEAWDAVQRNVACLDAVLYRIAKPMQDAALARPPGRVRLFEIFMLEEYFVGRHEPAAVVAWQRHHNENLRNTDVLSSTLSEYFPSTSFTMFLSPYRLGEKSKAVWT